MIPMEKTADSLGGVQVGESRMIDSLIPNGKEEAPAWGLRCLGRFGFRKRSRRPAQETRLQRRAMASISTSTFLGSVLTATAARAGLWSPKCRP